MRWPCWTLRKQMIGVAITALMIIAIPVALRAPHHYRISCYMSGTHEEREAVNLGLAKEFQELLDRHRDLISRSSGPVYSSGVPSEESIQGHIRVAAYHDRMRKHWNRVAFQPWRSMRSELAFDLAEQLPDAWERSLGIVIPDEFGKADY